MGRQPGARRSRYEAKGPIPAIGSSTPQYTAVALPLPTRCTLDTQDRLVAPKRNPGRGAFPGSLFALSFEEFHVQPVFFQSAAFAQSQLSKSLVVFGERGELC